jgi:phospholipid-binding lipoprotein MlaA
MKSLSIPLLLVVFLTLGCAHGSHPISSPEPIPASAQPGLITVGSNAAEVLPKSPEVLVAAGSESPGSEIKYDAPGTAVKEEMATTSDQQTPSVIPEPSAASNNTIDKDGNLDFKEEGGEEEKEGIADPLEPFNRAMYHFNDKLYFWVLKPLAQGYQKVVPEVARVGVSNFFTNLASPIRFVNCLLQGNFRGAASELGRFAVNTLWGIGGLLDLASSEELKLSKQDGDFGQTLGVYGLGQGFYIHWPILGPSSPRDTIGKVGDFFLYPLTYLTASWETFAGIWIYDKVNATSLSIGDYESLQEAAIDPYVAVRDAYVQYRLKKVNRKGGNTPSENSGLPKK